MTSHAVVGFIPRLPTEPHCRFWYRFETHCRDKPRYPPHDTWEQIEAYLGFVSETPPLDQPEEIPQPIVKKAPR